MLIIEKASELFAENGFTATSVQDITDACGISKGAFYLSFKSKDSLLFSIFEYFSSKLIERMSGLDDYPVNPRERFALFISIQFEEIARYSDFILMQMREQVSPVNEEMLSLIKGLQKKTYEMQESLLLEVYGEEIREHMPDLLILLSGMTKGYIEIIVFNKETLNYGGLASYIVARTDSIVNGLSEPFLKKEQLVGYDMLDCGASIRVEELLNDIGMVKLGIIDEDLLVSLEVIEQEIVKNNYRKPVISGMIFNLENTEATEELVRKLKLFMAQSD